MVTVIAAHFVAAAGWPVLVQWLGRRAFLLLALVPAGSAIWLLPRVVDASTGTSSVEQYSWAGRIGLDLDLMINPVSGPISLLVTGVGALVLVYCAWYFKEGDTELWRFGAVFVAFAGSMLGLVLSDNIYLLYVFWELTTLLSFLLVGHNPERRANRRAAMTALIVTTFGGLAMLVGFVMLDIASGTVRISEIVAQPPEATATVQVAVALVLVGALSKSALVPFHFWLPGAMAAPTPVSAYLHAAAMVKAGVFLVAVLAPPFSDLAWWRPTLILLGLTTMVIGGLRALRQHDVKLLLAYGTVSQLGFLMTVVGLGTRSAAMAGLALVASHAMFKATLFLVVGVVDRSTGTRDLRELSGLARQMPWLFAAAVVAGASMAGVPPTFGFLAKEAVLAAIVDLDSDTGSGWGVVALVGVVIGSILTVAYTARFLWGTFGTKPGVETCTVSAPSAGFIAAPVVLSVATLATMFATGPLTTLFLGAGDFYGAGAHEPELVLWHGFTLPLGLTVVTLVLGGLMFVARPGVAAAQIAVTDRVRLPDAERSYHAVVRGIDRFSIEVTGRTQRGSLPFYLGTILVVVALVPGSMLVRSLLDGATDLKLAGPDRPLQAVVSVIVIVSAIAAVRSRRRLRAVLLVGLTGYGMALLFVAHGAPDLALTQVLVETFLLVTFVLVLRRLPPFFSTRPFTSDRWIRVAAGVVTGTVMAGIAALAASSRVADPVGLDFAGPAYDFGGGRNIVNVTLVDIRAWDTLGELSVLVVAATGIASLIHLLQDRSSRITRSPATSGAQRWLGRESAVRRERRSVVFEVITRLIFHSLIVYAIYITLVGHNEPGGGFAGGLIAGLALMIRYLVGGRQELNAAAPVDAGLVLGVGLATAATAGLVPTLLGGGVLQSAIVDIPLGPLGELHLVTSVFFDIGVFLVVVGLALDVLRSLGGGIDQHAEEAGEAAQVGGGGATA
ncbi:Na+/H+ antiporter subunit A [Aeromicrobium sp. CF3.5]|uniref:Na+/H+ antiporter subunit A n=1 Tax=Aeromicrobium sp. CF3.5 TaxID=3373078 RepID=UPI003EE42694